MESLIFMLVLGTITGLMNWGVQQASDGRYSNWLECFMGGIQEGLREIESLPPLEQAIYGGILGILESAVGFLGTTVEDVVGDVDNVGDFFHQVATTVGDATFQSLGDVASKIGNVKDVIKDSVEAYLVPALGGQESAIGKVKESLDGKLGDLSQAMTQTKDKLAEKLDEQLLQSREVTANLEYALADSAVESVDDLKTKLDNTARTAMKELEEAMTTADTNLNAEVFTTTLQMKMLTDVIDTTTKIDDEEMKQRIRQQASIYKDLYLESLKQYKSIIDMVKQERLTEG